MTVKKLIAILQTMPLQAQVCIVYDSAVCTEPVVHVEPDWQLSPSARKVVAIMDEGSHEDLKRERRDHAR